MQKWIAVQKGIYLIPHLQGSETRNGWEHNDNIPAQIDVTSCRKAINEYADRHNLISAFVTPRLHRMSVRRWERAQRLGG